LNSEIVGYNVPFTILESCINITFGLWDTWGPHDVYYELSSTAESEIIFSGSVYSPGCAPWQMEMEEEMNECEISNGYNCGNSEENPCNEWVTYDVECLSEGEYNFLVYSLSYPGIENNNILGDIIGFIDINSGGNEIEDLTIDSPSPYGLYDMAGNVSQWLNKFPISSTAEIRGGNWGDTAENLISWKIIQQNPMLASNKIGFRCMKPISVNLNRNPREMLEEHKRRHRQPPLHPEDRDIDGP